MWKNKTQTHLKKITNLFFIKKKTSETKYESFEKKQPLCKNPLITINKTPLTLNKTKPL